MLQLPQASSVFAPGIDERFGRDGIERHADIIKFPTGKGLVRVYAQMGGGNNGLRTVTNESERLLVGTAHVRANDRRRIALLHRILSARPPLMCV